MIDYLKIITLIVILIPMIINSIMLYILTRKNKTGTEKNNLKAQDKYLPAIIEKLRNLLRNIVNNKELKIYYISRCKAELFIYILIFIIYLI